MNEHRMNRSMDIESIKALVAQNESHTLEFKRSTTQLESAFETVCAFLNEQDGIIFPRYAVNSGSKERNEVCEMLHVEPNGRISEYLHELQLSVFIKRDYSWKRGSGVDSKLSKYRLSDNHLRFYMKYIGINCSNIDRNSYRFKFLNTLARWHNALLPG